MNKKDTEIELDYSFALPNDTDLDDFESGVDGVDEYFQRRKWFNEKAGESSPPTYKFQDGEKLVGFAAAAFRDYPHPHDESDEEERYLVVYMAGVDKSMKGKNNPNAQEETYAVTMFRTLERFAREDDMAAGVGLWVRADNKRAISFYEKIGMEKDENGPEKRYGAVYYTMRKIF